jgi:hypothetical protein
MVLVIERPCYNCNTCPPPEDPDPQPCSQLLKPFSANLVTIVTRVLLLAAVSGDVSGAVALVAAVLLLAAFAREMPEPRKVESGEMVT